jgi:hypothetical protein
MMSSLSIAKSHSSGSSPRSSTSKHYKVGSTLEGPKQQRVKKQNSLHFEDSYRLTQKLRSGSYGTVYICVVKAEDEEEGISVLDEYAVKVIDRT